MSLDSRGIRRGHCIEYGCSCIGYDGGVEMKRCTKCPHPPGKHTNLSNAGGVGSSTSYVPAAYPMGSHTTPHNLGNHNFGGDLHYNAGGSVLQSYQPSHVQYHQPTRPHPQLRECQANGCFNHVHCDPSLPEGLREFSYCSPECRDRHLLPLEKVNLTVALSDMKKKLQEVAAAEKRSTSLSGLQRQSSSEYSSRPAAGTSYLVTGVGRGYVLGGHSSGVNNSSFSSGEGNQHASRVGSSSVIPNGAASKFSSSSAPAASVGGARGKQAKEQATAVVMVEKIRHQPFGVLLSKRPYTSDETFGFMIIGARRGSPAYFNLQGGKIKFFDVIESVNKKTCSDLFIPPNPDPQRCFDEHTKSQTSIRLCLSRSVSLPPVSELLTKVQKPYTHIIALRYSPDCTEEAYGLTLNYSGVHVLNKVLVGGRTLDTPAYDSGMEFGDEICMYAAASTNTIGDIKEGDNKIDEVQSTKKSVILMIWRYSQTKV